MVLIVAAILITLLGLTAVALLARALLSAKSLPVSVEWIDELSADRYRPMLRLLSSEDLDFLRFQPGFTPRMARKFRVQRCQIFRTYLGDMDADFKRICAALKLILLQSKVDRPDLASTLLQRQLLFAYRMMAIQFQVVLYRFGVRSVDVSGLWKSFDGLRLELQTLVPAEMAGVG